MDSILVDCADLEASCIGRAIKLHWDLGVQELGTCRTGRMVVGGYVGWGSEEFATIKVFGGFEGFGIFFWRWLLR